MTRSTDSPKRPLLGGILSLIGGLLVLAVGVGLVEVKSLALSGNLQMPQEGLIGQVYTQMLGTGFAGGASYVIGVVTGIIPGIIMVMAAVVMLASPSRANKAGYFVLVFAYLSLIGVGGLAIGAVLGIFGGSMGVLTRRSSPRLVRPPRAGLVAGS